jgi:hypothetical protein
MRRPIIVTRADGETATYPSIRAVLQELTLHPPSVHRALKHHNPLNKGPLRGWSFRYADIPEPEPETKLEPVVVEEFANYPNNRFDAKAQGATHYFTGLPCKHGHISLRKAQGACVECIRLAWEANKTTRKGYFEAYRKRPEVVARSKNYYKNIKANKAAEARVKPPPEIPVEAVAKDVPPAAKPTYKELIEQARVKPRA